MKTASSCCTPGPAPTALSRRKHGACQHPNDSTCPSRRASKPAPCRGLHMLNEAQFHVNAAPEQNARSFFQHLSPSPLTWGGPPGASGPTLWRQDHSPCDHVSSGCTRSPQSLQPPPPPAKDPHPCGPSFGVITSFRHGLDQPWPPTSCCRGAGLGLSSMHPKSAAIHKDSPCGRAPALGDSLGTPAAPQVSTLRHRRTFENFRVAQKYTGLHLLFRTLR